MQPDVAEQGAGAPAGALAGLNVYPGVAHRDIDPGYLLERFERVRADPRAVRADL